MLRLISVQRRHAADAAWRGVTVHAGVWKAHPARLCPIGSLKANALRT